MERIMSRCFTWFPFGGLGKPKLYQNMWCFTRKWGFYLEVLCLCEELSGGYSQEMMGLVLGEDLQVITSPFHIKEIKIIDEII